MLSQAHLPFTPVHFAVFHKSKTNASRVRYDFATRVTSSKTVLARCALRISVETPESGGGGRGDSSSERFRTLAICCQFRKATCRKQIR